MADMPRHDPDRELFGQGLANIASPLFGGMPATGAIARTAVNVRSGARTRSQPLVHAVVLVLVVLFAGEPRGPDPAGGAGGRPDGHCRPDGRGRTTSARSLRSTRSDAVVLCVTAFATVAFDLILAVEIGLAAAAVLALRQVARTAQVTAGVRRRSSTATHPIRSSTKGSSPTVSTALSSSARPSGS